ncbi:MAG: deoxyribose-phosphate aldolase [bacterium]|nr:deoxyribose-phosphate aldolase [bacterium]
MKLTSHDIARMMDVSVLSADTTEQDVRELAAFAKKYQCIAVFTLPGQVPLIKELLADEPNVGIGGAVGFPSGGEATATKVAETKEMIKLGCNEIDTVINIGMLRSGRYQYVKDEIKSVVDAANGLPVKVILECHYLTDDEIRKGCELCVEAGVAFVKTGTGWAPSGATPENITLMKSCVGDTIRVKAAGGVRDLDTLAELYRCGARRFGLGLQSAINIFDECAERSGGVLEL